MNQKQIIAIILHSFICVIMFGQGLENKIELITNNSAGSQLYSEKYFFMNSSIGSNENYHYSGSGDIMYNHFLSKTNTNFGIFFKLLATEYSKTAFYDNVVMSNYYVTDTFRKLKTDIKSKTIGLNLYVSQRIEINEKNCLFFGLSYGDDRYKENMIFNVNDSYEVGPIKDSKMNQYFNIGTIFKHKETSFGLSYTFSDYPRLNFLVKNKKVINNFTLSNLLLLNFQKLTPFNHYYNESNFHPSLSSSIEIKDKYLIGILTEYNSISKREFQISPNFGYKICRLFSVQIAFNLFKNNLNDNPRYASFNIICKL